MRNDLLKELQSGKVGDVVCYTIGGLTQNNYTKIVKITKCYFFLENGVRLKKTNGQGRMNGSNIYFSGLNCKEENWETDELDMWYY